MCVSSLRQQRSAKRKVETDSKSDKATVAIVRSAQKLGCVSQDVELPEPTVELANVRRSILKKSGKRSPRAHLELKYTKTAEQFIKLREQVGPSLGVIQGGAAHHPTFAYRNPTYMLWAEYDERKSAWQWPKQLYILRGTCLESEATFFSPKWNEDQHLSRPSMQMKDSLLWILVPLCK